MAEPTSRKRPASGRIAAKPAAPEPVRNFAPRGIAALIAPVLRPVLRRRGAALAMLIEDWQAIVGPDLAAHSLPVKSAAGTLTIGCAGPVAMEMQHMAPVLLGRINLALGGFPILRLRFSDLPAAASAAPPRGPQARSRAIDVPPDQAALPEGPVGDALARLRRGLYRVKPD